MAHEVIKRVGARAYRYRVESYRDPENGKVRSRWTYLGRAGPAPGAPLHAPKRHGAGTTRERLIDAFERLVERESFAAVSAGAVAAEASLAHGTFYRYFPDKRAMLVAALERVRDEFERDAPSLSPPYGSRAEERTRVRAWIQAVCRKFPARAGILRAWLEALETDAGLRAQRVERRRLRVETLRAYLEALAALGMVVDAPPAALATALVTLVDATFRESVAAGGRTGELLEDGILAVFDRSIFGGGSGA